MNFGTIEHSNFRMYRIQEDDMKDMLVEEPQADYGYTYADYLKWTIDERIELFKGRILKLSAPNTSHQIVSRNLFFQMVSYLRNKPCQAFSAPFDVRLPIQNRKKDDEVTTVVQPDLCVICDPEKLDVRGCCGAPDLVVEILSPGNSKKEVRLKFEIYQEACVLEYWIVNPVEQNLVAYSLDEHQQFTGGKMYTSGDMLHSTSIEGLIINMDEIFETL